MAHAHIAENIAELEERISRAAVRSDRRREDVTLIAITKTVAPDLIRSAHAAGIRHFGENRVQEAAGKLAQLSDMTPQATWHMVGHLQTNKAKHAIELFDTIHSIDSVRLAETMSAGLASDINILLQVNLSREESKSGFGAEELGKAFEQISRMPHLRVQGLMTIPPWAYDPDESRPYFQELRKLGRSLGLEHLSMGMTDDFEVAIEEGATMIRIGRGIFGERKG